MPDSGIPALEPVADPGNRWRKRVLAELIEALFRPVRRLWRQTAPLRHLACEPHHPPRVARRILFETLEQRLLLSGYVMPVADAIAAPSANGADELVLAAEVNATPTVILGAVSAGQPLTVTDADGTQVTFTLSGAGAGEVSSSDEGFDVNVTGSSAASALAVTTAGGDGRAELHDLDVA